MKTYKRRNKAFKHALKRAQHEGHQMMVIFNTAHNDMVVRKSVGQRLSPEQVRVAVCSQVQITEPSGRMRKEWRIEETKHGLEIKE
jgi:hypothetical protein